MLYWCTLSLGKALYKLNILLLLLSLQVWVRPSCPSTVWSAPAACSAPPTAQIKRWWRRGDTWPRASGWSVTRSEAWRTACSSSTASVRRDTASRTCWPVWSRSSGWTPSRPSASTFWVPRTASLRPATIPIWPRAAPASDRTHPHRTRSLFIKSCAETINKCSISAH